MEDSILFELSNTALNVQSPPSRMKSFFNEQVSSISESRIIEPERLEIEGGQNLVQGLGRVQIIYTDQADASKVDEDGNALPDGYLSLVENNGLDSNSRMAYQVFLYVKKRYLWDSYLHQCSHIPDGKRLVLRVFVKGLAMGWEPDGSGSKWENPSEPLWIRGFLIEHRAEDN